MRRSSGPDQNSKIFPCVRIAWRLTGAKVCRGGCGIAIVYVYREGYLAMSATYRDNLLFPRDSRDFFVVFRTDCDFIYSPRVKFLGFLRSEADLTNRYKS